MRNRLTDVILVILGAGMIVIVKHLENTGYKMSWLVILIWRCCVTFSINLSTHLPL